MPEACSSENVIRIQRSRPSALAALLALLLTMIFVYASVLPAFSIMDSDAASAEAPLSTQLRMEGLEVHFQLHERTKDALQARILAAQCIGEGGAGMILSEGGGFAVVCGVADEAGDQTLQRSAGGLTLKVQGNAQSLAAIADAVSFLCAQATETAGLAAALENGDTDAASVQALLGVYRTRGGRVLEALEALPEHEVAAALQAALTGSLQRLSDDAATLSGLRLLHAAACGEWIALLEGLV